MEAGLAMRGVAVDTQAAPAAGRARRRVDRRPPQQHAARDPAALLDARRPRDLSELAAAPGPVPVHLLMVRAGDHYDLARDPRPRAQAAIPVGFVERRPEFVAAALELHCASLYFGDGPRVEIRQHAARRR